MGQEQAAIFEPEPGGPVLGKRMLYHGLDENTRHPLRRSFLRVAKVIQHLRIDPAPWYGGGTNDMTTSASRRGFGVAGQSGVPDHFPVLIQGHDGKQAAPAFLRTMYSGS